jgi:hypothetical protein
VIVRAWAEKFGAIVIERNENLGLARSIATAVTELCENSGASSFSKTIFRSARTL